MYKKKMCLLGTVAACVIAGLVAALVVILKHEPGFYTRAEVPPSAGRQQHSSQFVSHFGQLMVDVGVDRGAWAYSFSQAQLNSFFQEDFVSYGEADNLRKLRISEPRIVFEEDRVRLAFRYGRGIWSTVL